MRKKKALTPGDSWWKYPKLFSKSNVIAHLNSDFDIDNIASNGREAGAIMTGKQKLKITKLLTKKWYDFVLFSGSGNDLLGQYDMDYYIDDGKLNLEKFDNKMDMLRAGYIELIERMNEYSINPNIKLVTHTYDFIKPSNVGYKVFGIQVTKSWVKPYMEKAGVTDPVKQQEIITAMLLRWKKMLMEVASRYDNFYVTDTQGLLDPNKDYLDEIHPTSNGFRKVAMKIKATLDSI